jgi:hypothetical protein
MLCCAAYVSSNVVMMMMIAIYVRSIRHTASYRGLHISRVEPIDSTPQTRRGISPTHYIGTYLRGGSSTHRQTGDTTPPRDRFHLCTYVTIPTTTVMVHQA